MHLPLVHPLFITATLVSGLYSTFERKHEAFHLLNLATFTYHDVLQLGAGGSDLYPLRRQRAGGSRFKAHLEK
jgi:hypothetical protein